MKRPILPTRAPMAPAALLALAVLVSMGTAVEPAALGAAALPASETSLVRGFRGDPDEREAVAQLLASLTDAAKRLHGCTPTWPGRPAARPAHAPVCLTFAPRERSATVRDLCTLDPCLTDLPPPAL